MALSLFDVSVPVFQQMLRALDGILNKASAHASARRIAPEALLGARLFPDMFPLTRQVQSASDHAKGASARLAGVDVPSYADTETTFEELSARIAKTLDFIGKLDPAAFAGAEDRDVTIVRRTGPVSMNGRFYLLHQALPNFYFHTTTAYAILRHNGVEIGKSDFLGPR